MRKRYGSLIAALLVLAAAGSWLIFRPAPPGTGAPAARGGAGAAVPVSVTRAERRDVPVFLEGLGNVQAFYGVTIRPQVDGQLIKVAFKEGQDVHAGEVLAQIDPRTFQAALDQALAKKAQDEAQLANARIDMERYAGLVEKNYIARQQLDTTRAQVNQLRAAVQGDDAAIESARVQLGYTTIASPIDGRAGIRQVDPGNIVHASDPTGIVVITQVHPISVLFTVPEENLPRIVDAMAQGPLQVEVLSRDGKQQLDVGVLQLVDNQIDQSTGTARLKATLPNKNGHLWPGQFVNARLRVQTLRQVVTMPAPAVQRGPEGAFAFVVKGDRTVEVRKLILGPVNQGMAVVEKGIEAGDEVVTEGQYRLKPGTAVEAKTADSGNGSSTEHPE